jgi:hypothetical protein
MPATCTGRILVWRMQYPAQRAGTLSFTKDVLRITPDWRRTAQRHWRHRLNPERCVNA